MSNGHGSAVACPDFAYIRKAVPIRAVAEALGLRVVGKMAHCWRPENHQHDDRTPSVGLHQPSNIAKCFVCDPRSLSPLDLVISVRGVCLLEAGQWIAARFHVPCAPKGKHVEHQARWPEQFRVGASGSRLDALIRSGIWASLTPAQRSIVPVLETFADSCTGKVTISYRGIMRHSGVRSQSTLSTALKRFRALRFLKIETSRAAEGLRGCNTYALCFEDAEFLALASECFQRHRREIEQEREIRRAARAARCARRLLPVNTLSTQRTADEKHSAVSRSVNSLVRT